MVDATSPAENAAASSMANAVSSSTSKSITLILCDTVMQSLRNLHLSSPDPSSVTTLFTLMPAALIGPPLEASRYTGHSSVHSLTQSQLHFPLHLLTETSHNDSGDE